MRVSLLGCGGSQGVPLSTGDWGDCDPFEPRNRRRRPCIVVETETAAGEGRTLLFDTSPDLREQLLSGEVHRIDAVLFTHGHADHTHGIDDLRAFFHQTRRAIPAYGTEAVLAELTERFAYAIDPAASRPYRPILETHVFDGPFEAVGIPVVPIRQDHGFGPSTGFRIGNFAYSVDVLRLDEAAFAALAGITHWIVDCQQIAPHPSHSHLAQTLEWIERLKPRRAILAHLGPKLDYRALVQSLPAGVEPGYDGLVFDVDS